MKKLISIALISLIGLGSAFAQFRPNRFTTNTDAVAWQSVTSDIPSTNVTAFSQGTNFYIDFNWRSQTLLATGDIAFSFSTNWGLSTTGRVASVFIPATNYLRHVLFQNASTNWHVNPFTLYNIPALRGARLSFQQYGPGETNVVMTPFIDEKNAGNITNIFDLSSLVAVPSATNVLWLDATRGVFQSTFLVTPAQEGSEVRGWQDMSGRGNDVTNNTGTMNTVFLHNASTAPFNIPCLTQTAPSIANTWLRSKAVSTLTQPVWVFFMVYGTKGPANVIDSLSGSTTRIVSQVSFDGGNIVFASDNSFIMSTANTAPPRWQLYSFKLNGGTSLIRTNGVTALSGNAGAGIPNGFTIFGDQAGTMATATFSLAELAVFWGNLSNADLGNIETNYFRRKYGAF